MSWLADWSSHQTWMPCRIRSIINRLGGVRWSGHCWDQETGRCVDCGKDEL